MRTNGTALNRRVKTSIAHILNTLDAKIRRRDPDAALRISEKLLAALDPRFSSRLLPMYRGEPQRGIDNQLHPINNRVSISAAQGMWLYEFCVSTKPKTTLEIGMAYGFSTIFFLAAIAKNQAGHHTSIDPFQSSRWQGIGLAHAQALAPTKDAHSTFLLLEDRSDRIGIDLARASAKYDVIFIDGNHRFDDALVDFCLYAPLTKIGGHIIFDDMWMSSIQTVAAFVRANRTDFVEVPTDIFNICVFRKVSEDTREWKDFKKFAVSRSSK